MNGNGDRCSAVERCSLSLWIWQSVFVFFSVVAGPMSNAGGVPESLRWGHGGPLSESLVAFLCLGAGTEPAVALAQHNSVAGRLEFCQEWTSKLGSYNACYVNQNRTNDPRNRTCEPARGCPGGTIRFPAHHQASASAGSAGHSPAAGGVRIRSIVFCFDRARPR